MNTIKPIAGIETDTVWETTQAVEMVFTFARDVFEGMKPDMKAAIGTLGAKVKGPDGQLWMVTGFDTRATAVDIHIKKFFA